MLDANDVSDRLMSSLGRFIVKWAQFDFQLGCKFSHHLGASLARGLGVYFSGTGFAAHRDLVKVAVASSGFETPSKELLDFLAEAEEISTLRNDLVHGEWKRVFGDQATISVFKPRNEMRSYLFDISAEDLDGFSRRIDELCAALENIPMVATRKAQRRPKNRAD